jgi:hypothetical protein
MTARETKRLAAPARALATVAFALAALAASGGTARAQTQPWATSGTNINNTNTGNVGVGTSSPSTSVEVRKDAGQATGPTLTLSNGAGGPGAGGAIDFSNPNISLRQQAQIRSSDNNDWSAHLLFLTKAPGGSSNPLAERMRITSAGNVGIGTNAPVAKLHVAGDGRFTGNVVVDGNIAAKYQDVAEWVPSRQKLAVGTVVVLDPARNNHVMASSRPYDTGVAGVVSASPGVILGEGGEGKLIVATTGRVRIKVDATRAPVRIGDLLVTSDAEGVAMKSVPVELGGIAIHRPGTIIGKALEPLDKGVGEILVLLSMQ